MQVKVNMMRSTLDGLSRELPSLPEPEQLGQKIAQLQQSDPQFDTLRRHQQSMAVWATMANTAIAGEANTTTTSTTATTATGSPTVTERGSLIPEYGQVTGSATRTVLMQSVRQPIMVSRAPAEDPANEFQQPMLAAVVLESEPPVIAYREPRGQFWHLHPLQAPDAPPPLEQDSVGNGHGSMNLSPMAVPATVPMAALQPLQASMQIPCHMLPPRYLDDSGFTPTAVSERPAYDEGRSTPLINAIVAGQFDVANRHVDVSIQGLNKCGADYNTAQHYLYAFTPAGPNADQQQVDICALAKKLIARTVAQRANKHGLRPIDYARAFNPGLYQFLTGTGPRDVAPKN